MHPHITRGSSRARHSAAAPATAEVAAIGPVAPGGGHERGFAAAVIEQVHVGVAEVAVRETVNDVVEAGLAHAHPRTVVERLVGDGTGRGQTGDHCERSPEEDENDEAEEVGFGQREIGAEPVVGLVVGLAPPPLHGHVDAQVDDEGGEQRDQHGGDSDGHARWKQFVVLALAVLENGQRWFSGVVGPVLGPCGHGTGPVCRCGCRRDKLERTGEQTDQPDEHEHAGCVGLGEPIVLRIVWLVLTYHAQSDIVLDGCRLRETVVGGLREWAVCGEGTREKGNGRVSFDGIPGISQRVHR